LHLCSDCSGAGVPLPTGEGHPLNVASLLFHELRRAIDAFLIGPMAEGLGAVECKAPSPSEEPPSISSASAAKVEVSHILGTPDAAYSIRAFGDELSMKIQLNVYRLVLVYSLPAHQAQDSEALKPRFARWELGAGHAGWHVGWRDSVLLEDAERRTAEIYCYAMLPTDFLVLPHHQLYWINDIVQMTKSLFLECRRIGLRLSC
jgi:hypothetical protein